MNLIKGLFGFAKKEIIWLLRAKDRNFDIKPDYSNSDIVVQDFHKNLSPKQWQNIDPSSGTVRVYEDLGPIEASWPVHSPRLEVPKIKVYVWVSVRIFSWNSRVLPHPPRSREQKNLAPESKDRGPHCSARSSQYRSHWSLKRGNKAKNSMYFSASFHYS